MNKPYHILIENEIIWQNRKKYLQIMVNFINQKIDGNEFFYQYTSLFIDHIIDSRKLSANFKNQKTFKFHLDNSGIASIIGMIYTLIMNYFDPDLEGFVANPFQLSSSGFRYRLRVEYFPKLANSIKIHKEALKNSGFRPDEAKSLDYSKVINQLVWDNKDEFFELIEEFFDDSSNFLNLKKKYQSMVNLVEQLETDEIYFELNYQYQAFGFSNFLEILIKLFDSYQTNPEVSPKVFKSWVEKIFFEMKRHYS